MEIEQVELENKLLSEELIKKELLIDEKDKQISNISSELAIKFNHLTEFNKKLKIDNELYNLLT